MTQVMKQSLRIREHGPRSHVKLDADCVWRALAQEPRRQRPVTFVPSGRFLERPSEGLSPRILKTNLEHVRLKANTADEYYILKCIGS